jgi:hypothetical protein
MPTFYVEDFDGEKADDAVEPVVLSPVFAESKVVDDGNVEDKTVKSGAAKASVKKKA